MWSARPNQSGPATVSKRLQQSYTPKTATNTFAAEDQVTTSAGMHIRRIAGRLLCLGFLLLLLLEIDYARHDTPFPKDCWWKKESASLYESYDLSLPSVGVATTTTMGMESCSLQHQPSTSFSLILFTEHGEQILNISQIAQNSKNSVSNIWGGLIDCVIDIRLNLRR